MTEKELMNQLKDGLKNKIIQIDGKERIFINMVEIPKEVKQSFVKKYGQKYANNVVEPILKEFKENGLLSNYKMTVNKKSENCITVSIKK